MAANAALTILKRELALRPIQTLMDAFAMHDTPPKKNQQPIKNRDISLDAIRLLAIFLVISIHVSAKGFSSMGQHWWAVNFYESISRISVPLFFMVTGALLLHRESSIRTTVRRIWRIGIPLIIWSILYLCWFKYTGTEVKHWLTSIMRAPIVPHFWYLYTLLGAYLFMPVMVGFCKINDKNSKIFTLIMWFIGASVVPTMYVITGKEYIGINWGFLSLYAGYIILGAMLIESKNATSRKIITSTIIWLTSTLLIAYLTWRYSLKTGMANETFYAYTSPFVAIGAISAFYSLRATIHKVSSHRLFPSATITKLGEVNFGVYLIHVMVMFWLDILGFDYQFTNPWIAIPCVVLMIFCVSAAIIFLIQRIPLVKNIAPN